MSKNQLSFSENAINYSWQQLALRAGANFSIHNQQAYVNDIPLFYGYSKAKSYIGKKIIVIPCKDEDWHNLIQKDNHTIDWALPSQIFPVKDIKYSNTIPIIFYGNDNKTDTLVEYRDDALIFYVDIVATVFFMLSRWEETLSSIKEDIHGRFPASASVAYKQGFLNIPIVDLYGLIFKEWLSMITHRQVSSSSEFTINLTHDIDWISRFASLSHFLRVTISEFIKKKSILGILKQIRYLYIQTIQPTDDDFFRSINNLAELSEAQGIKSKFYFMAVERNQFQQGYNPASVLLKNGMNNLQDRGHEIGIHPGYTSFKNVEKLISEKETMEQVINKNILGGRQHFLRFQVPHTWRHWEQAGLMYDSTMGYADHEGFRCGTSYPYHPFDIDKDETMRILEIPLIVMDTTLRIYRKLSPEQAKVKILELANICRNFGGHFTLLWHNTSLVDEWAEWGQMYQEVLVELSRMKKVNRQ